MTGEIPREIQRLAEQIQLDDIFAAAHPAEDLKGEIGLEEPYSSVTEFRMNSESYLVKHTPTQVIGFWSVMTGPRRLRASVSEWVDRITGVV